MHCNKIILENFRNIDFAEVDFTPGINIIIGDNAQGKTNLLEGIYFSALTKSFRTPHDADTVKFDRDIASLSLDFSDSLRRQNIKVRIPKDKRKQVELNNLKISKSSEIVGALRIVLFCPEHLSLIKEGPGMRRNFLDVAISQLRPLYLYSLQRYNKILKERNKLIRDAETDRATFDSTIEFWSEQLALESGRISVERARYTEKTDALAREFFREMTEGREIPVMRYISSSKLDCGDIVSEKEVSDRYRELLMSNLEREIGAGTTLYGIHRDDIEIDINEKNARLYASQGQQRSLVLSMKLAEGEICRLDKGEQPVFLFDDVLSELDAKRKIYMTEKIKEKQVILTTCEKNDFPDSRDDIKVINVRSGVYE